MNRWASLDYAAAFEAADAATQAIMGEVWNARVRSVRAQSGRARAKAGKFDDVVKLVLDHQQAARRANRLPPMADPAEIVRSVAAEVAGVDERAGRQVDVESVKKRVRRSLARQGLR